MPDSLFSNFSNNTVSQKHGFGHTAWNARQEGVVLTALEVRAISPGLSKALASHVPVLNETVL